LLVPEINGVKFCHGRSGRAGLVPASECTCTARKKCQALKDRESFLEQYESMEAMKTRREILNILDGVFSESDWYKDNVIH